MTGGLEFSPGILEGAVRRNRDKAQVTPEGSSSPGSCHMRGMTGNEPDITRIPTTSYRAGRCGGPGAAGAVRDRRFSRAVGRADSAYSAAEWTFSIRQGSSTLKSWTWPELQQLPAETATVDIHCVTRWSKLDTEWRGVSVDTLLDQVEHDAGYVMAFSDGGYTTNLPLADVTGGKAWVAFSYAGAPLEPEHGGPARLLVPHLYFWKSAKWVRGLELMDEDRPGFWETYGYNMYGDPWKEQRYQGD